MADLVIILFILFFVFLGYKKGLVNTLLNMCSYLLSIIGVAFLFKPFYEYLSKSPIGINITDKINTYLIEKFSDTVLSQLNIPQIFKSGIEQSASLQENTISYALAQNITSAIFMILTFIILYFVIKILLKLMRAPLNFIASLPIIKQANKLCGLIFGAAMGFLWLYVITSIIGIFAFADVIKPVADAINNSTVMKFLYDYNFLLGLIKF
ncbi:MAG: CvpA family protein [Ruminococcaceae bacterium]|nr:CvpA family protein [Oscillospiraceae bacterium]